MLIVHPTQEPELILLAPSLGKERVIGVKPDHKSPYERPKVVLSHTSSPAWFNTKSDQWAYEREWRMLRVLSEADSRTERTPFPLCLFRIPEDAVLEIIVGLRSTPSLIQQLEFLAAVFPRATLLQANESATEYSLCLRDVS